LAGILLKTEENYADQKRQEETMIFHIGTTIEGELCARSEVRYVRVWRLSELIGEGIPEEHLEGLGYCPLREKFPGCPIKGDEQFNDTLYTTTLDQEIRPKQGLYQPEALSPA
jgi:hypothetical protein